MALDRAAQLAMQRKLNESYLLAKAKNSAFSMRAFAKKLSVSHSSLSEILKGKRTISRKMAARLLEKLALDPKESRALLELFPTGKQNSRSSELVPYLELSSDVFHVTAEWYYFAILSLCETADFKADPRWISRRLNLPYADAQVAIRRLLRLKMLVKIESGKYVRGHVAYSTTDDVSDAMLRQAHATNLALASQSLERDPVLMRDFSSITMPTDPRQLTVAKQMIREFQDRLSLFLESSPKTEVYRLCVQLFPLSRREGAHVH